MTDKMLPRKRWHASITEDRIIELHNRRATSLDDPGLCLACGAEAEGVEPDSRNYSCDVCGDTQVFGIEDIVIAIL